MGVKSSQAEEPRCVEVVVQRSGGGKVAIKEYGKVSSQWGVSFSRRYIVPEDWDDDRVDEFQIAKSDELRALIEPIDQAEFDERYKQRDWKD